MAKLDGKFSFLRPSHTSVKREEKRIMNRFPLQIAPQFVSAALSDLHDPRTPGWPSPSKPTKSPAERKIPHLRCPAVSWGATSACLAGATLAPLRSSLRRAVERLEGLEQAEDLRKTREKKQEFVGESSKLSLWIPPSAEPFLAYTIL